MSSMRATPGKIACRTNGQSPEASAVRPSNSAHQKVYSPTAAGGRAWHATTAGIILTTEPGVNVRALSRNYQSADLGPNCTDESQNAPMN